MTTIPLAAANAIIAAAFAKGAEMGLKPLSVVVVDAGGHVIAFQRQDGSPSQRLAIALGKTSGALGLGVSSRRLGEMAVERPAFVASLAALFPNGAVPAAGAVLVAGADGAAIGAVGVSGDTSDNDEVCALAGLDAAGLKARG